MTVPGCCAAEKISDKEKFALLEKFIDQNRDKEGYLIPVLHAAQSIFGYLPPEVQSFVAGRMDCPESIVSGVVTFYSYFRTTPPGRYTITVCLGTACYVRGGKKVLDALEEKLGVRVGGTTGDRRFSLQVQRCLGACGLAPAVMVNKDVYGRLSPKKIGPLLEKYT